MTREQLIDKLAEAAWLTLNHDNDWTDGEPHNVANWKNLRERIDAALPRQWKASTSQGRAEHD